jgi:hypothetical protein
MTYDHSDSFLKEMEKSVKNKNKKENEQSE